MGPFQVNAHLQRNALRPPSFGVTCLAVSELDAVCQCIPWTLEISRCQTFATFLSCADTLCLPSEPGALSGRPVSCLCSMLCTHNP